MQRFPNMAAPSGHLNCVHSTYTAQECSACNRAELMTGELFKCGYAMALGKLQRESLESTMRTQPLEPLPRSHTNHLAIIIIITAKLLLH